MLCCRVSLIDPESAHVSDVGGLNWDIDSGSEHDSIYIYGVAVEQNSSFSFKAQPTNLVSSLIHTKKKEKHGSGYSSLLSSSGYCDPDHRHRFGRPGPPRRRFDAAPRPPCDQICQPSQFVFESTLALCPFLAAYPVETLISCWNKRPVVAISSSDADTAPTVTRSKWHPPAVATAFDDE